MSAVVLAGQGERGSNDGRAPKPQSGVGALRVRRDWIFFWAAMLCSPLSPALNHPAPSAKSTSSTGLQEGGCGQKAGLGCTSGSSGAFSAPANSGGAKDALPSMERGVARGARGQEPPECTALLQDFCPELLIRNSIYWPGLLLLTPAGCIICPGCLGDSGQHCPGDSVVPFHLI